MVSPKVCITFRATVPNMYLKAVLVPVAKLVLRNEMPYVTTSQYHHVELCSPTGLFRPTSTLVAGNPNPNPEP